MDQAAVEFEDGVLADGTMRVIRIGPFPVLTLVGPGYSSCRLANGSAGKASNISKSIEFSVGSCGRLWAKRQFCLRSQGNGLRD